MNKEELRELIRTTNDKHVLEALWELYDLKFKEKEYVYHDKTIRKDFDSWTTLPSPAKTVTYDDRRG